jgi:beta-glucosidase-like glycosyl hydrolase/CubicO group peptidase (beta-lactamase class C family)
MLDRRRRFFFELICLIGLVGYLACAKPAPPTPEARSTWAHQVLAGMSLEEKVGQMILGRSDGRFLNENDPDFKGLVEAVQSGRIGGVVFFQGDPFGTAAIANRLQDEAPLPLLMASDYEWGAAFRVEGATRFPSAMAVAAGGDEEDAAFQAEVTAREARAMGIHLLLAPVVDLNTHPANSVISRRSFGEDPERVGRLASAFIRRAQEKGVLATIKHFPGHGATAADSHLTLPVVRVDRKRLDEVELSPFQAGIEAGVAAVMVAHIAVPAIDGRSDRPATFSREIVEGVLKGEMGFDGLVVSDALDMGGARERWWGGEVAVSAVDAGCDLLLVPPDPRLAWDALCRAVRRGEIAPERIDRSVLKILEAKARLNLHQKRIVDLRDIPRRVGDPRFRQRVQKIADRSITLLAPHSGVLPLRDGDPPLRILLMSYTLDGDRRVDPSVLLEELEARTEHVSYLPLTPAAVQSRAPEILRLANASDVVVLASFRRSRSAWGRGRLSADLVSVTSDLIDAGESLVGVGLGNPHGLTDLPGADALLAAYDDSPASQRAVAKALFGEIAITGRLPVSLSERYPAGHGIDLPGRQLELVGAESPGDVGFSRKGLANVERVIRDAVKAKAFPGAVAVVGRRGNLVLETTIGRLSYERDAPPVRLDTLYDLASMTKVVATTTLAMILSERGELVLERPVSDYIPEFGGGDKDRVTVADLLAHSGGLLWWKTFFKDYGSLAPGEAIEKTLAEIYRMPLDYEPRSKTVYSDLGILLLGQILERVSGRSLEDLIREEVLQPLGMTETMFNPPPSLRSRIAPTEVDPWRGRLVHGEVHDENAFALGGVAPHAGLFSTGADLARFAQMMLNGGIYGDRRILKHSTIERFTHRAELVSESSRALGWDTPSGQSSSGRYFSKNSFGHTGFTGTSIWIDPEREVFAILLTNRVHPTRDNQQIREVRPAFYDAVMKAIVDVEIKAREP